MSSVSSTNSIQGSGIIAIDVKGVILSVDLAAYKLLGYSCEELVGHKINAIIPRPYREQHDTYLSRYASSGIKKIIGHGPRLVEAQTKGGQVIPVTLNVTEITIPGKDTRFIGVLQSSEENSAVVTIHAQTGEIINVVNSHVLGFPDSSRLIGQSFSILIPAPFDKHPQEYLNNADKVMDKTRNVPLLAGTGAVMNVSMKINQMSLGDDMSLYRAVIQVVDPTIQLVFSVNEQGIIMSSNTHFVETILGKKQENLLGVPFNTVVPDCFVDGKIARNVGESIDCLALHMDGSSLPVHINIHSFKHPDGSSNYSIRLNRGEKSQSSSSHRSASKSPHRFPTRVLMYELGDEIERGMYGRVYKATHIETGAVVAIKLMLKSVLAADEARQNRIKREIVINRKCSHSNLVHLYEVCEAPEFTALVMEYISGGSLCDHLSSVGAPLHEPEVLYYCRQLLDVLGYLHGLGVVHRDIKDANILMERAPVSASPPWSGVIVKLIDFGLATHDPGDFLRSYCGTPAYAAPEMLRGEKYDGPSVDIWSLGVVIFRCLTLKFPFDTVSNIMSGTIVYPMWVTPKAIDFLSRMLVLDAAVRASVRDLMSHPWLRNAASPPVAFYGSSQEVEVTMTDVAPDHSLDTSFDNPYAFEDPPDDSAPPKRVKKDSQ